MRAEKSQKTGVLDEKSDELGTKANEIFIRIAETRKDIEGVQLMIDNINARITELDGDTEAQNMLNGLSREGNLLA